MYLYIYVFMYLCIYVFMYLCIYVFMYLCIYVFMYLCIYVCIPGIGGDTIIEKVNALRNSKQWELVVLSKDWHPVNHVSFIDNHTTNPEAKVFSPLTLDNGAVQVMWPKHCVQDSDGEWNI
jgi:nicotinamidase-related amidase